MDTAGWTLEYLLDSENLIVSVGGEWDEFARANDASGLSGTAVIGRPLLDFISGKVTRGYVLKLLDHVSTHGQPIELDYRCDSPETRRFLRMIIMPLAGGGVRFRHRLLREEARALPVHFHRAAERVRDSHVRCSMCNHIRVAGCWGEAEALLPLHELRKGVAVIYGLCQTCMQKIEPIAQPAG
ncbi:MAG: hypothetical protein AB1722_01935 [Pseudomonadota bacterium]